VAGRGPALVLYGAALAYFTSIGAVIPTLPRYLVGPLHGSGVAVGIAVASFSAGAIAARLPVGAAADRWGWPRRSLLVAGATVLATSTALLIAGPSAPTVFALRALAGIADALFYTAAAAATAYELAPVGRAGAAVSHFTVAAYLGLLAGPVLGETLRAWFGFGWVWAGAAAAAGAAALLAALLPAQRRRPDHQPHAPEPAPGRHLIPTAPSCPGSCSRPAHSVLPATSRSLPCMLAASASTTPAWSSRCSPS
jgi:MFS family permease